LPQFDDYYKQKPKRQKPKINGSTPFDWFDRLTTGKLRAGELTTGPSTALRASWVRLGSF
jgi:hypothetical protein